MFFALSDEKFQSSLAGLSENLELGGGEDALKIIRETFKQIGREAQEVSGKTTNSVDFQQMLMINQVAEAVIRMIDRF